MSALVERFGLALAERSNPIVVKELRQGLRTRAFGVFFTLLLVACLLIALVAVASSDGGSSTSGRGTFAGVFVCLAFVEFMVIPYGAYRSMLRERDDETWVLLCLTGLAPRRILAGKVVSAAMQGGLYASAAAPFLLFSYYLGGIDLPSIAITLVVTAAAQILLSSLAVSAATLAESKVMRGVINFALLGVLLVSLTASISLAAAMPELVARWVIWSVETVTLLFALFACVSTSVLAYETAAARLALATEGYARGPRMAFVAQLIGFCAFSGWGAMVTKEPDVAAAAVVALSVYLLMAGVGLSADFDGMSKLQWTRGAKLNVFKPGALRGYALALLAFGLVAVSVLLPTAWWGGAGLADDSVPVATAALFYGVLYLSTAVVVGRALSPTPRRRPLMVRATAAVILVLGSILPPLVGAFLDVPKAVMLNMFNPVVGLINVADSKMGAGTMLTVEVTAVLMGVAAWVSLWRADQRPR